MLENNQMHPPDHIVCDDNKLQPTRRRKKKKEQQQQQQQQVLGKASKILPSSFLLPTALRIGNKDKNTDSDDPNFAPKTQRDDPHSTPKTITNSVSIFFLFKKIHNHVHN
jgi:membrane protein insertase Oxa1/YidC/SpoIIIJ